jgi:hypothetical protein
MEQVSTASESLVGFGREEFAHDFFYDTLNE